MSGRKALAKIWKEKLWRAFRAEDDTNAAGRRMDSPETTLTAYESGNKPLPDYVIKQVYRLLF
ncbi:hypothetical protein BDW02DRAFT_572549 [Decorospora gaudefroyi]|uniref:Uncharacterized protein n=1 Tax=Decorospora gaudefroyi TaxID=184978 RepID=A0A6A5KC43_9PLEO|nr:hypothetical protein BDW02DRAFT_572549 [Decorospora gaudefroyi]